MPEWPIELPIYEPDVLDNSQMETYSRCPRLFAYQYLLRRGPVGHRWSLEWGSAYHKYREVVEKTMIEQGTGMNDFIHQAGLLAAMSEYPTNPPHEHRKSYLTRTRLEEACTLARERIAHEQSTKRIDVLRAEDSFDLELPFRQCESCLRVYRNIPDDERCPDCGGILGPLRFGGRMDQVIDWNNNLWIRDFKTTGMLGKTYPKQFEPNNQITGYCWAGEQLSGRPVQGTVIEVVYITKRQGPEFHQFISTRTPGQLEQWLHTTYFEIGDIYRSIRRAEDLGYLAFPQRTSSCTDYGGCYYRDACKQDSSWALERWLENNTEYSYWDFTNPDGEDNQE